MTPDERPPPGPKTRSTYTARPAEKEPERVTRDEDREQVERSGADEPRDGVEESP